MMLVLALSLAARAEPTEDAVRRLHARHLSLATALARGGPAPAEAPIAYVPIAADDLATLVTTGVARAPVEFSVYPNLSNPIVARFQDDRPDLRVAATRPEFRDALVEHDAWTRGVIALTRARARAAGRRVGFDEAVLTQFFARLRRRAGPGEAFSPDAGALLDAAADVTSIGVPTPAACETLLTPYVQELINAGPEKRALVARHRLRDIAMLYDVPWDDVAREHSPARRALESLFADLPARAGFVVSLGGPAFNRVRWSKREAPKLYAVELPFVTGLEALGPRERSMLERLARGE